MPLIALGLRRAISIKLMPKAFKAGMSASSFRQVLRGKGLQYRWQTMLGDWRTTNEIERKKDALKYVRKDRIPSPRAMIESTWSYKKEYVYTANTWSRIHPDDPLKERLVSIQSDIPLTPSQAEEEIAKQWVEWERYFPEKLERIQMLSVYHRVPSPLDVE